MRGLFYLARAALAGAVLAGALGAFAAWLQNVDALFWRSALTAAGGGLFGLGVGTLDRSGAAKADLSAASILSLLNPLALYSFCKSAPLSLAFAAAIMIAGAAATLANSRDYRAAIALSLALAVAPFVSASLLPLYPGLFLLSPLVSPWGFSLRKTIGFLVVVWTPLAMTIVSLAYLHSFAIPFPSHSLLDLENWRRMPDRDLLVLASGGAAIAFGALSAKRRWAGLAFIAGGFFLALAHPEWRHMF